MVTPKALVKNNIKPRREDLTFSVVAAGLTFSALESFEWGIGGRDSFGLSSLKIIGSLRLLMLRPMVGVSLCIGIGSVMVEIGGATGLFI